MGCDYSWARRFVPRSCGTVGELAILLGVGRHQARRRLLASGLPCWLLTRRWKDLNGSWYVRRAWVVPPGTAKTLLWKEIEREWERDVRLLTRMGRKVPPEARSLATAMARDVNAVAR